METGAPDAPLHQRQPDYTDVVSACDDAPRSMCPHPSTTAAARSRVEWTYVPNPDTSIDYRQDGEDYMGEVGRGYGGQVHAVFREPRAAQRVRDLLL